MLSFSKTVTVNSDLFLSYFSIHGVPVFCSSPGCENFMILNPEKSHYLCLGKNPDDNEVLNFNDLIIKSSLIKSICRKASQKLSTLLRISSNLNMKQNKLLYKSMIKSQFNYCPLVWMFRSRQSNNLINQIHERSLRISYKDQKTSYHRFA